MNEQHLSEQNAETFKLKLEQDEETENLRKVSKITLLFEAFPMKEHVAVLYHQENIILVH